jgi:hypothetical protein
MPQPSTVLNAAKIVIDRTEKLDRDITPDDTLIDVTKLSTDLLRLLQAELRQIAERDGKAKAPPPIPWPIVGQVHTPRS